MSAIRGAYEEAGRLRRQLAGLEADGPPGTVDAVRRRARLELQITTLEAAIQGYDDGQDTG